MPLPLRWGLIGLVALILLSMVVDAAMFNNKIHAGVTIEGQSVSGLTQDEAVQTINDYLTVSQDSPITLTGGGKGWQVKPSELGTKVDVAAAVTAALNVTRANNLVVDMATKLKLYFGSRDIKLQGTVDATSLDTFIGQIATTLDKPAVNAGLAVRGATVAVVEGKEGLVVDKEALTQSLTQTLLSLHSTDITIPMVKDEPEITSEDNEAALTQAKTIVSAPLTLTWGSKSWTFTPQEIATFIEFTPQDATGASPSKPYLSAEKMAPRLQLIGTETTFKIVNKKVQVVPGVEGVVLDPNKTAEALTAAAITTTGRTAEVQGTKQSPKLTTAQAEAMGITDLLATYSDTYVGSKNRQTNVHITTEYVLRGGKLYLAPGEEFDFKKEVGPRTPERGYVKAPGISPGIVLEDQYGGGICEVSTAVFNAALLAGLKITERTNHSIYFDHYPKGRDATVSDPGPNLRFVNDTGHYVWIMGKSDGKTTTINVYGTSDGRKVSLDVSKWYAVWGPYTSTTLDPSLSTGVSILVSKGETAKMCMLTRTITWPSGKKIKDHFESNYKHQYALLRVGTGTTTTTVYKPPTTTTLPYAP
jgi:vancomycin resistance protein YoaR